MNTKYTKLHNVKLDQGGGRSDSRKNGKDSLSQGRRERSTQEKPPIVIARSIDIGAGDVAISISMKLGKSINAEDAGRPLQGRIASLR